MLHVLCTRVFHPENTENKVRCFATPVTAAAILWPLICHATENLKSRDGESSWEGVLPEQ